MLAALLAISGTAHAEDAIVTASQVTRFADTDPGGRVGALVWEGGLVLSSSADTFGGLSGITFVGGENHLVMVTDRGQFVSGQLLYDEAGLPSELIGVTIEPIRNSSGAPLPRPFARDAEALDVIVRDGVPSAVRVGFENLTRVADFSLDGYVPRGAAREIAIPQWLSDARTNATIESVCIAPPASPIAGSTLILTEGVYDEAGRNRAWLLGQRDAGALSYVASPGTNPSDCAFLPNGDLLVLERGIALFAFTIKLKRVPAAEIVPGAVMSGEILLESTGGDIDNLEGLAVHAGPRGETRITIISDNNFNSWQRNLLLQFSLPQ
ncbi:esterase-like activity of phytase family protein [Arsenicitalea aurantiaca]|uniref:esterase-like activity of phytase family protein n=1 Tax=Arsenicitalea aurantiaca TaxID=1783274 RepID=UPI0013152D65|nr:esterase-like activity of phytase family protein [Arsenicitalea aurantiaca]